MFGGLEMKGADDKAESTAESSNPVAPAPALSSFGFMNTAAPEPAPAAPAPAASSFSFLNPASPEASATPASPPAAAPAPAASGFSFMMQDTTTTTASTDETEPAAENPAPVPAPAAATSGFSFMTTTSPEPAAETPAPSAATATATSGFSFMTQDSTTTSTPEPATETPAPAPSSTTSGFSFMATPEPAAEASAPAPVPAASSGFDFMNSMGTTSAVSETPPTAVEETLVPTIAEESPAKPAATGGFWSLSEPVTSVGASEAAPPRTIHTRTNSVSSASSALSAPSLPPSSNPAPTQTGGVIAGAGVTFGTSASKPRIKKKKSRAARVGVGASQSQPMPPAAPPAQAPAPAVPTPAETKSSRDAALEASNRAEAFMQAKAMEVAKTSIETTSTKTSSASIPETETVPNYEIRQTESTDEVLAAARKAAEEAKMMQQKGKGGGFMGTFFKGFRPSNTGMAGTGSVSNNSKHSVGSQSIGSNSSANAVDRLAKEQKAMKEAMAKRQLEEHKQQSKAPTISQSEEEDDDDVVVVSTSVGGYTPAPAPEPMEYTPVTETTDSVTKNTLSEASAFVPPSIPPATQKSAFGFEVPMYGAAQQTSKAPVPPPKSKLDNTPKDKFEHHQDYFSNAVNQAMKKVEDARSLKKGLLEERFVALAKDRFATREIEQIEELQQAAIEEEDYELADELGQKLDAHKREKGEVENMLENNKKALEKLDSENTSLGVLVVSCFEDLALRLDNLKKTELESEKKDDNDILTQYASISKQLSAENERLQQDLKHLERDEQLVSEERKELEDSIKDQTGEIETQKDEASVKLTEVEKEIEELRKAVQEKQKEAADLRTKMFGYEDSISKVRVKFSRQLTRVDKKEISLKESRREWEIENEQHKKQKDAHDLLVKTHSDNLLAQEKLLETLDAELKLSKEFSEIIPSQIGMMEDESDSEEKEGDDDEGSLAQLKANVVKCEGAIDIAKKALKMASMTIQNLQTERDMLVDRIPDLESRKKAAAAGRDFKSAGKFSKEIKEANARIKQCEDELDGEAKTKKAAAEEELRQLDSELVEARKVADAEEKLSGEKRMESLAKKISQLAQEKVERCGDSKSDGKNVTSVAARVLEGQIAILKAEGLEIGQKYGGWDELMKSIGLDDATDDVVAEPVDEADQEEGQEKTDSGLASEERLEKAKELLAKCSELEEKVQEAAEREDFEAAGELQEILDKINTEIEELNITDEECLLLAEVDTVLDTVPPEQQEEEEQPALTDEERLSKAKELLDKQSDLEQKVEEAVETEDFEAADELQTSLDQITAELAKLNVTDEEKEYLTMEGDPTDEPDSVPEDSEETIAVPAVEEEKKEVDDERPTDVDEDKGETSEDAPSEEEDTLDKEKESIEALADDDQPIPNEGEE